MTSRIFGHETAGIIAATGADEVTIPINPNILYRRENDLMGSYSSSYRIQTLAADIIFNQRIVVLDTL